MSKSVTLIHRHHNPSPRRPPTTPFLSRVSVVPLFRVTSCRCCQDQPRCRSPLFSHPPQQHPPLFSCYLFLIVDRALLHEPTIQLQQDGGSQRSSPLTFVLDAQRPPPRCETSPSTAGCAATPFSQCRD
ncbi:hypothetical protein SESBI_50203 [Sesbania bispinosa]|nr:hypothetical protein SESBI_50203 [Sesbania bispinosa]